MESTTTSPQKNIEVEVPRLNEICDADEGRAGGGSVLIDGSGR